MGKLMTLNIDGFKTFKFADPLYHIVKELWGSDKDRDKMQKIGTFVNQTWGQKTFADCAERKILEWERASPDVNIITDDLRFPNELEMVLRNYFWVIKIIRDPAEADKCIGTGTKNHVSEEYIDNMDYDFLIENNGSFEDLYEKVQTVYEIISFAKRKPIQGMFRIWVT
jgi:hypothetical protein